MTTREEIAKIIRFALDELSATNGHHEFEQICRHLARARIASNVIPATGPVGAGGDQGRDLETFRTYLVTELGPSGGFIALASTETLAFACTIQRDNITRKVKSDVRRIMSSGSTVERIFVLLSNNLAIADRHKLTDWTRENFLVELEIFDGQWIAQELSFHDTFWIAERFLSLPAELAPPESDVPLPDWYNELLQKWHERDPTETIGDLLSVKSGLRHATFSIEQRGDLPFWLNLMRLFLSESIDEDLRRRSEYEVSVATLRGTGTLFAADGLVGDYLAANSNLVRPVDLENASVLLMYAVGAFGRGVTSVHEQQLVSWNEELRNRIELQLSGNMSPNSRAALLQTLGHLYLQPDPTRMASPTAPMEPEETDSAGFEDESASPENILPFVNLDVGLDRWLELMLKVDHAPFFPVERLADSFAVITPFIFDHQNYARLSQLIDDRVAVVGGQSAAAEKCRDRAVALYQAGALCPAIKEFHRAKIGWWAGDTIRGSLLSLMILSNCYRKLGLHHASMQYALQAARIASTEESDSHGDIFATGLRQTVMLSFDLGEWATAASIAESALRIQANFVGPLDPEDERVTEIMFSLLWIYLSSRDLAPPLALKVQSLLEEAHMWSDVQEAIDEQASQSPEHWLATIGQQIHGEWMADLKQEFRVSFKIYGSIWTIRGPNDLATYCAMHRFAAAVQILLADLFDEDLAFLKEEVFIRVSVDDSTAERVSQAPSTEGRFFEIALTPYTDQEHQVYDELLAVIVVVLRDLTLLPTNRFFDRLENAMRDGLLDKLSMGMSMDRLLLWARDNSYDQIQFATQLPSVIEDSGYTPREHQYLGWRGGVGPTYDQNEAREQISMRYQKITEQFPVTLRRLRSDSDFRETVAQLRGMGWLDWHVLLAVANVITNNRLKSIWGESPGILDASNIANGNDAVREILSSRETESDEEIPLSIFTVEELNSAREITLVNYLRNVGLELNQDFVDIAAVQEFLTVRYRYWSDDTNHKDPF